MINLLQDPKTKLIFILVLALAVRLVGIISRPIWYDEAFSVLLAEQGPSAILSGTLATDADSSAAEEHPPAYYFLLWNWIRLFGSSLISIRMLSVILSIGIILCIYKIAIHLFDSSTALIAVFFSAILPFQIHFGQEIRMYTLLTFWLCLATLAFLKRRWIVFSIAAALAQYTHNLAVFYLIPLAFTPVFHKDWKTLRSLTLAGFAAIVMYSPWLTQLPAQVAKVTSNFWIEKPGIEKIFTLFLIYLPNLPLPNKLLFTSLLISMFIFALAAYQTYRILKEDPQKAKNSLWLVYLSFAPPILLWLTSQITPLYVERALLPSHAIFCIWLAWVYTQTKLPRPIQLLFLVLIVTSAGIGYYQHIAYQGFPYGPYSALNQHLHDDLEQGDVIIHSNKLSYLPMFYYDSKLPQSYLIDPPGSATDTLSPAIQKILNLTPVANMETATRNATRVWLIIYQQSIDEFISKGFQTHPDIEYLDNNFTQTSTETLNDIRLYLYTRNPP